MSLLILVATLRRRNLRAAISVAHQHATQIEPYLNGHRLPSRSTYFDRFKKVQTIVEEAIVLMGKKAIKHRWADASIAAVDKSLMIAKGPKLVEE